MFKYYLSVCAIFKDEATYLKEWVEFHIANGVDHFYLYDNLSSDNSVEVLAPFVKEGYVTRIKWTKSKSLGGQRAAYQHCLETNGSSSNWIAFIDLDEFLFGVSSELPSVLRDFEQFGGVFVHWQNFGSSMWVKRVPGDVISRFTNRAPTGWSRNREGKSIVQPSKLDSWSNLKVHRQVPHRFDMADGCQLVNERGEELKRTMTWGDQVGRIIKRILGRHSVLVGSHLPFVFNPYGTRRGNPTKVNVDVLRINHYVVKSREEYESKMQRMSDKPEKYNSYYFRFHDRNEVIDRLLADRVIALQSKVSSLRAARGAPGR